MSNTITAQEAADILGHSVGFVTSHLLQTGIIKAEKISGKWLVDLDSVNAYIPRSKRTRIIPESKPQSSKEENRAIIQRQEEAVRAGRIKPMYLEKGISSI